VSRNHNDYSPPPPISRSIFPFHVSFFKSASVGTVVRDIVHMSLWAFRQQTWWGAAQEASSGPEARSCHGAPPRSAPGMIPFTVVTTV
jgi:hypothetical protein